MVVVSEGTVSKKLMMIKINLPVIKSQGDAACNQPCKINFPMNCICYWWPLPSPLYFSFIQLLKFLLG